MYHWIIAMEAQNRAKHQRKTAGELFVRSVDPWSSTHIFYFWSAHGEGLQIEEPEKAAFLVFLCSSFLIYLILFGNDGNILLSPERHNNSRDREKRFTK